MKKLIYSTSTRSFAKNPYYIPPKPKYGLVIENPNGPGMTYPKYTKDCNDKVDARNWRDEMSKKDGKKYTLVIESIKFPGDWIIVR